MVETGFEKKRGVSRIEVREGFAQVHVSRLQGSLTDQRLQVLQAVANVGVSIDFLKLTPSGLSFIVSEERSDAVEGALGATDVRFSVRKGRSIVLVHAVNIRDEEGLIAEILQCAITSGAHVDHVGDMHDRLLMVVRSENIDPLRRSLERALLEAEA
jgi:aspartate kinase